MLTFFWHCVSMLVAKEHPKHTLLVYAALIFLTIVVMAITTIVKNMRAAYTSKVCLGCSLATSMLTQCQKKVSIEA